MSMAPDSRVIRVTRCLLAQTGPRSTSQLAAEVGLSERVVRYRLGAVDNYLSHHGAELVRQRGAGLSVRADESTRAAILADLDGHHAAPRVYGPVDRERLLLDLLLWSSPEVISLDQLNLGLEVSKTSARRDLKRCEPWLDRAGLPVVRRPGRGIELVGSEQSVRRAIVQLVLESVPADVLDELQTTDFADAKLVGVRVPSGLQDRLAALDIRECADAVARSPLASLLIIGNSRLVFTMFLAIARARAGMDRPIGLEAGHFVSLMDHPATDSVRELVTSLGADEVMAETEVAGLTDYLLGLVALSSVQPGGGEHPELLRTILDMASEELHASLSEDEELRRSLAMHLSRLSVRLKYNLPVHNPLLAEVAERYPDVHQVSMKVAEVVGEAFDATIHDDEVGFITMYLSGAMERSHLRPRRQALVVCPSGMATAWVLVSRLQSEFPELALAEVSSAADYDAKDTSGVDIVISTVPLPNSSTPVVVVSPLLSAVDVEEVSSLLGG